MVEVAIYRFHPGAYRSAVRIFPSLMSSPPFDLADLTSIPHPSRDSTLYVAGLRDLPSINLTVTYFPFILTRTPPNSPRRAYTPFASLILFERENRRERKQSRESMGFTKGWVLDVARTNVPSVSNFFYHAAEVPRRHAWQANRYNAKYIRPYSYSIPDRLLASYHTVAALKPL